MTRKDATLVGIGEERIGWMQHDRAGTLRLFRPRNRTAPTVADEEWQIAQIVVLAVVAALVLYAGFVLWVTQ